MAWVSKSVKRSVTNLKLIINPNNHDQVLATFDYKYGEDTPKYGAIWIYTLEDGREYISSNNTSSWEEWDTWWGAAYARRRTFDIPDNAVRITVRVAPIPPGMYTDKMTFWPDWRETSLNVRDAAFPTDPATPSVEFNNGELLMSLSNVAANTDKIEFQILTDDGQRTFASAKVNVGSDRYVSYRKALAPNDQYFVRARAFRSNGLSSNWSDFTDPIKSVPAAPILTKVSAYAEQEVQFPTSLEVIWKIGAPDVYYVTEKYRIEYTDRLQDFTDNNFSRIQTFETDDASTLRTLIASLDTGKTYYVRVAGMNDAGLSAYSGIMSAVIGSTPTMPTTWSSATSVKTTDTLTLYWVHNPTDESSQKRAHVYFSFRDGAYTETIELQNTTDPAHIDDTSALTVDMANGTYTYFDTTTAFSTLTSAVLALGGDLKWQVDTCGVTGVFSDLSVLRQIDIYATTDFSVVSSSFQPSSGTPEYMLYSYPLDITASVISTDTQAPLSYSLQVIAREAYRTVGVTGNVRYISENQVIYEAFYDDSGEETIGPGSKTYTKNISLSAGDIDLENNITYTLKMTVFLNSGIQETRTIDFGVNWEDSVYQVGADFDLDEGNLAMSIMPACYQDDYAAIDPNNETYANQNPSRRIWFELIDGAFVRSTDTIVNQSKTYYKLDFSDDQVTYDAVDPSTENYSHQNPYDRGWLEKDGDDYIPTTDDNVVSDKTYYVSDGQTITEDEVMLSVYRRNYDNTFTLIADNIPNGQSESVIDPHPSLNSASYRIVARSETNGGISYEDFFGIPVEEKSIVIQWDESWSSYYRDGDIMSTEYPYAGSMLKLPWNIDISSSNAPDVASVEYIGRQHPVSYYGTQLGETASWSTDVKKSDTDTISKIRELMNYMGDVYVREPSGIGFWANIKLSYNMNHTELVVPVSIDITRVEGGI